MIRPLIVDIYMCVMYLNCDFSLKDPYSYEHYLSNSEDFTGHDSNPNLCEAGVVRYWLSYQFSMVRLLTKIQVKIALNFHLCLCRSFQNAGTAVIVTQRNVAQEFRIKYGEHASDNRSLRNDAIPFCG